MRKFPYLILMATLVFLPASCTFNTPPLKGHIVFVSNQNGNDDIYVMDANGQNVKQLTDNLAQDHSPAWSPDDKQVVFISNRDGNSEIYTMNADGSNQIRRTKSPDVSEEYPKWSPDGKQIVFSTHQGYLALLDLATGITHLITNTADRDYEGNPSWSPDGHRIVFQAVDDLKRYIGLINPDGSNRTILMKVPWDDILLDPTWSPDGSKIAFGHIYSNETVQGGTFIMSSDGSNVKHLTTGFGGTSWDPDSEWLVCYSSVNGNNNLSEIYIAHISDGAVYRLTDTPYSETDPDWSHK